MKNIHIVGLLLAGLFSACTPAEERGDDLTSPGVFTEEQKSLAGVRLGSVERRVLTSVVASTGEVEVPPQAMASVSVPLGGYLVQTELVPGDYVRKGQRIAQLSSPEYITLQQSWLETAGELKYAEQDFERQRTLEAHNATAGKRLQESESTYAVLKARLAGLQAKLSLIGVDIGRLKEGEIQSVVALTAPISGYVTRVNHHPGQFIEPREVVFEVVNPEEMHLHLNVFERDIARIEKSQRVRFRPVGESRDWHTGKVSLVSPKRNEGTQTFDIHAHIDQEGGSLKPGMYVEAEIFLSNDTLPALPMEAIVSHGGKSYVVVERDGRYHTQNVETGVQMEGWVEVRNPSHLENSVIVVGGASRLFAALQTEE